VPFIIAIAAAAIVAAAVLVTILVRRRRTRPARPAATVTTWGESGPPVAGFRVEGDTATVSFEVPLPDGPVDGTLADLLVAEAVEVAREKRHQLPIDGVTRVVAAARRGTAWEEVGSITLTAPGTLPPPRQPEPAPGTRGGRSFDPFDLAADLPTTPPGLADRAGTDTLGTLAGELRIPAALEAEIRAQGIDPGTAAAPDLVLAIMRLRGAAVTQRGPDTYEMVSGGQRTLLRVLPHRPGEHPEMAESDIRRFAADFATSGAQRALLITEKHAPFEVYERERRDPRARYITRERMQHFIDSLVLG